VVDEALVAGVLSWVPVLVVGEELVDEVLTCVEVGATVPLTLLVLLAIAVAVDEGAATVLLC